MGQVDELARALARSVRASEISDQLQGTAQLLHDVVTPGEEDDTELIQELDQRVFCCEACGWWCGVEELNNDSPGEQTCNDCRKARIGG